MQHVAYAMRSKLSMSDDWRRWIAENLMLNIPPEAVVGTLVNNGYSQQMAQQEVMAAMESPYLTGARQSLERLQNRLRKREWVLDIYRKLNQQRPGNNMIERRHKLTRDEFYQQYYFANRPVIITGMMEDWPAMQKWNFDYFRQHFGDREVEVQTGRNQDAQYEINCTQHKQPMRFADYVNMVEGAGKTNDFYMTANNSSQNKTALRDLWADIRVIPEYLNTQSPDDGFFWFGPAGTLTPFHHDLTNNFMAQVMGSKRVLLVPACEVANMYNHLHCFTEVDGGAIDYARFPQMRHAQVLECTLSPGEILFLPVGCWHYVEGLEPSVTMSFINFQPDNDYASFYSTYHQL
ncbi:cupin-like domain-containing protein [Chitinivorax sp. B]|uniref:cupin-like domain-containing protein n=1 Tax=Chitinivorax sp. B TaxID=2502235 RepID=UPI002017B48F|nr:cupin-like domain-containing protein [Chitinivorax sp. B]